MRKLTRNIKDKYKTVSNGMLNSWHYKKTKQGIIASKPEEANRGIKYYYPEYSNLYAIDDVLNIDSVRYKHISSVGSLQKIIIGTDDRIQVSELEFPYRVICLLLIFDKGGNTYWGTGFFISEKCVITAGHCVFLKNNWVDHIRVIPGANGNLKPFGEDLSTTFESVEGWTYSKDINFDYGAIILNDNTLYNKIQTYFDYKPLGTENEIEISGYPLDKNGTQWKSKGAINRISKYRLFYDLDTIEGNSGSPVFIENGDRKIVIGVHTFGDNPNSAIKLNEEILNIWTYWSKL